MGQQETGQHKFPPVSDRPAPPGGAKMVMPPGLAPRPAHATMTSWVPHQLDPILPNLSTASSCAKPLQAPAELLGQPQGKVHLHSSALQRSPAQPSTNTRSEETCDDRKESKGPTEYLEGRYVKRNISSLHYSSLTQSKNVSINIAAPVLPLTTFTLFRVHLMKKNLIFIHT